MRVFIYTQYEDIHAKAVSRALQSLGHEATLWYHSDLPQKATASLMVDDEGGLEVALRGPEGISDARCDRLWVRRPTLPVLPDTLHPADERFVHREWKQMLQAIECHVGADCFAVNPFARAAEAECKATQLRHAASVGFKIPPTLFSSDPERIRAFIAAQASPTIYKAFVPAQWEHDDGAAMIFTSIITDDLLPSDETLRQCPGIFQPQVEKDHELRVTMIGDHPFAVRLDSQALEQAKVDWRQATRAVGTHPVDLDPALLARCRTLMKRMGLVFGCIDIIVRPDGVPVFLEINQMGQFLWLEELDPSQPLLDAFCNLLIAGRRDFAWSRDKARLRFADFADRSADEAVDALHVPDVPGFLHPE